MQKQIAAKTTTILTKLGFADATIQKAEKDKVVATVDSKFPALRKAFSRQYGHCAHNVEIPGGRRATWVLDGKGTLIAKSSKHGRVQVTFATMPFIA